jgi:hypothetical protein
LIKSFNYLRDIINDNIFELFFEKVENSMNPELKKDLYEEKSRWTRYDYFLIEK